MSNTKELLNEREAAKLISMPVSFLKDHREKGTGPKWINLASSKSTRLRVRYIAAGLEPWKRKILGLSEVPPVVALSETTTAKLAEEVLEELAQEPVEPVVAEVVKPLSETAPEASVAAPEASMEAPEEEIPTTPSVDDDENFNPFI